MPASEGLSSYFKKLDRTQKMHFLMDLNMASKQTVLQDEYEESRKELFQEYFSPKNNQGELDTAELGQRLGELCIYKARLEEAFGEEVQKQFHALTDEQTEGLSADEKMAVAVQKAANESVVGLKIKIVNNFIKDDLLGGGLLSPADRNKFLESNKITPKTARTKDMLPEAENANNAAFMEKLKDVDTRFKAVYEESIRRRKDQEKRTNGETNFKFGSLYPVELKLLASEKVQNLIKPSAEKKSDIYAANTEFGHNLAGQIDQYSREGLSIVALGETVNPVVVGKVHSILSSTGKGDAWWHKNNSEKFEDVIKYVSAYETVASKKGVSAKTLDEAGAGIVKVGLAYVEGKEKVRDSKFGRERFDAVMTALAVYMDRAEFKALLNKINKKRGLTGKPEDPNYVSVEKYLQKANAYSRKIPMSEKASEKIIEDAVRFSPLVGSQIYYLQNMKGIGDKPLNNRDFATLASGAAKEEGKDPKEVAYKALVEYNSGNKESLAKLIADSIKKFAKENNGKEEVSTDWILNGEKIANLFSFLENDPELLEKATESGLTNEDVLFAKGVVEASKIMSKAEMAEQLLKSDEELKPEEKRNLYVDMMKGFYINTKFSMETGFKDAKRDDINMAHDVNDIDFIMQRKNTAVRQHAKDVYRGEKREYSSVIKGLGDPANRKALDAGCKNVANEMKPETKKLDKAREEMKNYDFQCRKVTNAVSAELENANKAQKTSQVLAQPK